MIIDEKWSIKADSEGCTLVSAEEKIKKKEKTLVKNTYKRTDITTQTYILAL